MSTQNTNDMFVTAARKKFRFSTTKGQVSVEDLFELSLESLDKVAVGLDETLQKAGKKSFIGKRETGAADLELQLEIVKFVIQTKMDEAEARKVRAEKAGERTFLQDLLERKKLNALENLPEEEILKRLKALE